MKEEKFSKWSLLAMGIGNVVGAGVVTLVGQAIGKTGYSAFYSYALALLFGLLYNIPMIFVSSAVTLDGGNYTLVNTMLGKRWGCIFTCGYFLFYPGVALYSVSLGTYIQSLFPSIPVWLSAAITLTIFFLINLRGLSVATKAQNIMSTLLIVGLGTFVIMGLGKADFSLLTKTADPNFMLDGTSGLFSAAFLLMFSTFAQYNTMYLSRHVKNPRKSVPFAIIGTTVVIFFLYLGVMSVAATVLPLDVVKNQPLTYVAREIMSTPLFYFFLIAGPFMCLATTTNSCYAIYVEPIVAATNDGWFGKKLAATNKHGNPWIVTCILYACTLIPIVLQWDINLIANATLLVEIGLGVLMMISVTMIPKRYPEAWANRQMFKKMPTWVFYLFCVLAFVVQFMILANSVASVKPYIVVVSVGVIIFGYFYSGWRMKNHEITVPVLDDSVITDE
ncbi:MAG: APC family permease [Faecousia sp.]